MALLGCPSIAELNRDYLWHPDFGPVLSTQREGADFRQIRAV
jgi:hypothetical protein